MTGPVFLFGTGRSGTTYFQRLITMHTTTWMWGEHGGVLGPVISAVRNYEKSPVLRKVIAKTEVATDEWLVEQVVTRGFSLSWLNRFSSGTLREEIAQLLIRMFGSSVPAGWDNWGFKEILYGLHNDVPDVLLDIFPDAVVLFSFREPKETLLSMLRSWNGDLCQNDNRDVEEFRRAVQERINRIVTIMRYFIALRLERGRKITFVSPNEYGIEPREFLNAIGLAQRSNATPDQALVTNRGPATITERALEIVEGAWREASKDLEALYAQALSLSESDFGAN